MARKLLLKITAEKKMKDNNNNPHQRPIMPATLRTRSLLALALALTAGVGSLAQAQPDAVVQIPRVDASPRIDGVVSASEWTQARRLSLDFEISPAENIPARVATEALLMEDGETLYIAFIAEDPNPEAIRSFYRDRDRINGMDFVGIGLDTFNDETRSFNFVVTPLGTQFDSIQDERKDDEDESWNAIWDSEARITDSGYEVEMAIPLRQLRFRSGIGEQIWGVKMVRDYPRDRLYRFSNVVDDRDISCMTCEFAKIRGFANVEPGRNIEITPTLTSSAVRSRPDPARDRWSRTDSEVEAGVDLRWGINENNVLNATLNPDFSQVEADSAQLDVNNTFSLFFPEKRTFFLDGADYFNTALDVVHTRNIADPDYGVKLTGTSGRHSYGLLQANDTTTSFMLPNNQSNTIASLGESASDVSILRYRQEVLANSSVGAIVTHRSGEDYSNTVAGIDSQWRLSDSDVINAQALSSRSEYPLLVQQRFGQEEQIDDQTYMIEYRHNDRRWDLWMEYVDFGDDFRADLGFINRVDFTRTTVRAGHTWRYPSGSFFDRIRIALDWDQSFDQAGRELEEETEVFLEMRGPYQSSLDGLFGGSNTWYNGQYFDEKFSQLSLSARPTSNLYVRMLVRVEDVIDFANTRLGESRRYSPEINYQWGRHLQLGLQHTHQTFDVSDGRLFTVDLTELRATYQFSVRSFLRLIIQHEDNERDQALYRGEVQARSRELATQLLYSYKLTPQTLVFLGYSDSGFQNDALDRIETSSRTIFAKFSYAWQH